MRKDLLDPKKLLGYRLLTEDELAKAKSLSAKAGAKPGSKAGVKGGAKIGAKFGGKPK